MSVSPMPLAWETNAVNSGSFWPQSLYWFVGVGAAAFLVSWVLANRLGIRRQNYIGALTLVTGLLAWGYLSWAGISIGAVIAHNWGWGLIVAPFAAAFGIFGMTRLPATNARSGGPLVRALLWEGGIYGVAEGVLLSVLPAVTVWQLTESREWNGGAGFAGRWVLPLVASVLVIVVHHLGYREYRNRQLIPITIGCGLLTLGFLLTGSVLAAVVGHVLMHLTAVMRGTELPPHEAPASTLKPADEGLPSSVV